MQYSLRFQQATASNIGGFSDKNNAGNRVDLNLKLGLANHYELNHQVKLSDLFNIPVPVSTTPSLANFNFNGSNTSDEEIINHGHVDIYHSGTICDEDSTMVGGPPSSSHGLGNGRTAVPSTQETGSQPHAINLNNNVLNPAAAAADQNTSSMLEVGGYFNTDLLPPATLNNYILLDSSSRDAESGKSLGTHRCRCEICHCHPRKTCLNPLCGTNNTPMWRGGPLGPRTLCNACGIRYKREKVRRRA